MQRGAGAKQDILEFMQHAQAYLEPTQIILTRCDVLGKYRFVDNVATKKN